MKKPIERAIKTMWERHHEPISLDEMACGVHLSRFYFSRMFRSATGTSPVRFLTAIRLYNAKIYLRETSWSVTEIAYRVGYTSLGTFITLFTRSVGASPMRYRTMAKAGMPLLARPRTAGSAAGGTVRGIMTIPELHTPVCVYVGLFASPVVQGVPAGCTIVTRSGEFAIADVPAGEWFLRAAAIDTAQPSGSQMRPLAVGARDAIRISGAETVTVDVALRITSPLDLPIVFALPELDTSVPADPRRPRRAAHPRLAG